MLEAGQTIDRYELLRRIGEGGMAEVWAARQRGKHGFEKLVAVKVIHSRFAEDPGFRAMFLDEARIVASIEHRNVAQLLDLGESGSVLYLVMEYVDGDSLFALIAPERRLPAPIALRIAAGACAGLDAVHRLADGSGKPLHVVHRDISPQNILLDRNGEVKLIDFGIAHARDRAALATEAGTIKGKARYMAPEQVRREAVGPATDVFGLGAVLFRMLAGRAPYASADDLTTLEALADGAPPLHPLPHDVPAPVAAIVLRAIAPRPHDRYATASDMQTALETALGGQASTREMAQWLEVNASEHAITRRRELARAGASPARGETSAADTPSPLVSGTEPTDPSGNQPPPPAPREEDRERSFMDIGALVAQARGAPPPARPAPAVPASRGAPTSRAPLASEPPAEAVPSAVMPAYVGPMTPGPRGRARPGALIKLTILVVALVLVTLLVLLLIPRVVRDRIVAGAREAGLELTIEGVGVGFDGVSLRDVTVRAPRAPGLAATIPAVHLSGLTGKDVRLHDPRVKLSGSRLHIEAAIGTVIADARAHFAGAATSARHVSVIGAHVTWDGVFGAGTRLSAGDIGVEIDSRGPGAEDVHGSVGGFEVVLPGANGATATLGPWASSFETSGAGSRVRVMFDPPVPDGPSLLYVGQGVAQNELTVRIPRSPLSNLGVKPESLGLPATAATEVEALIEGKLPADGPQTFHGTVKLWGVRPKGMSAVNVSVVASAVGAAGKPFQIDKAIVEMGPFAVGVTGTLVAHDHGLRFDAVFKSLPLTCASLAKDQVKTMGSLVETLHAFGETTGLYRITGNVNVSGVVKYDTAEPDAASVTWLAKETCGVSIFGR